MTVTGLPTRDVAGEPASPPPVAWTTAERLRLWAIDNRAFCVVAAFATVLRLVVLIAYAPALEFFGDSPGYLREAADLSVISAWHPIGYPLFIWLTAWSHGLLLLTLLQHALGLLSGWLVYRTLRGLGVNRGLATVAALPLLIDAYQVAIEQFVLSDTLFTFLVVAMVVLCVRLMRRPSIGVAFAVGAVLAGATLTRTVGLGLALPVAIVLLMARVGWRRIAAAAATFALPLGGYALAFHATYGAYALQGYSGRYLYGIVAPVVHCTPNPMSDPLCPTSPPAARPGSNEYVWNLYDYLPVDGTATQRSNAVGAYARHAALSQPMAVGGAVAGNFLHYFAPSRTVGPRDWFVGSWQFPLQQASPAWNSSPADIGIDGEPMKGSIHPGAASLLRDYQNFVYVPGPLLLLSVIAAIAMLVVRRLARLRNSLKDQLTVLLVVSGVLLLAIPSATAGFDWRYALPAQALLLPAGALALHDLWPSLRRRLGRALPWAATVVVGAVLVPNIAMPSVYAASTLTPRRVAPLPAVQSVGGHLDISLGRPTVIETGCRWDAGKPRVGAYISMPMTVGYRSGAPMLLQSGNFDADHNGLVMDGPPDLLPVQPSVPNMLLSSRYPRADGTVYALVWARSGVIRYVDPVGAGAAAWSYSLRLPPTTRLGSLCTGSLPWAGATLPWLHITGVPPFTTSGMQTVGYRLTHEVSRAKTFDVRMRVITGASGMGAWRYPPQWQHTAMHQQHLLNLVAGATYCFEVRARDALDAATAWSPPTCTTRLYDDASLPPGSGWSPVSGQQGFYNGTLTEAVQPGATVAVAAPYAQAALLLYHCPTCGTLDVYAGQKLLGHINLRTTAANAGMRLWTSARLPAIARTLTLRVTSPGLVAIDGFGLSA
ncbi:MAG TPA: phospholipid carrier-dependent glycosyltransferase [Mycobacteriales bacterium]|nr:phospholipid carrier-dependent glycosyltransferase [Mycobacteriales bacterium]